MKGRRISGVTVIKNAIELGYPLEFAVDSVMELCDEYIISDGNSSDGTAKVLSRIRAKYPGRIEILHHPWIQSGQGEAIAEAQNHAILHARGDWIILCQADEIFHEGVLPTIVERIQRRRADSISLRFVHLRPDIFHQVADPAYLEAIRVFRRQGLLYRYLTIGDGYTSHKTYVFERFLLAKFRRMLDNFRWGHLERIQEPSIYHVGYCIKARERIGSHATSLYPDVPSYEELSRRAATWDGDPDTFWQDVEEYSGSYPKLLIEWWNQVNATSSQGAP